MTLRGGPIESSSAAGTVPSWDPTDFHQFITNFLSEGVVQSVGSQLAVSERGAGANMSVDVAAGLALVEVTTTLLTTDYTFKTWLESDAVENVVISAADATNPRKDRIVAKFDMTADPNATAGDIVSIAVVEGTPAGSPSAPSTPTNGISLAIVDVAAAASSIVDANITDDRSYVEFGSTVMTELQREAASLTKTRLVVADETELTIASGGVTVTQPYHKIDTESDAASDDLDTITAAVGAGEIIILFAENDARTVVVKNGTGNILTADGEDYSIDSDDKSIVLLYDGTNWKELSHTDAYLTTADIQHKVEEIELTDGSVAGQSSTSEEVVASTTVAAANLSQGVRLNVSSYLGLKFNSSTVATLRLKIAGNTVATFATTYSGGAGGTAVFHLTGDIVIRTDGAGGTAHGAGALLYDTSSDLTGDPANVESLSGTLPAGATVAIDTTSSQDVELTVQYDTNSTNNQAQSHQWNVNRFF